MGGSAESIVIGYKYYMTSHLIFALSGITAVRKIRSGDKTILWSGSATSNSTLTINKSTIYGGDGPGGRGGFQAKVDLMFGGATQVANSYLAAISAGLNPAYRRRFGMVFRGLHGGGAYVGNTGSAEPIAALLTGADTNLAWQPSTRWITAVDCLYPDMNPAHILRDLLLSDDIGLTVNEADLDDANFASVAADLYAEGFGISMMFSSAGSVEDHIAEVCRHANCILFQDHSDGLYKIKLLRDDYDIGDVPVFNESNSKKTSFSRTGVGELCNRVVVIYHDVENNKNESIAIDDLALTDRHGGSSISKEVRYDGISSKLLAQKVGGRDLKQLSTPLAKVALDLNRQASTLRPGDVIKWSDEELGIVDMPLRIFKMSYGTAKSNHIKAELVEDIFSYGETIYTGGNGDSSWEEIVSDPEELTDVSLSEVPYFFYYDKLGGIPADATATQGEILIVAAKETQTDISFKIQQRMGVADYAQMKKLGHFAVTALLSTDITHAQTAIAFTAYDFTQLVESGYFYLDDELIKIVSLDYEEGTMVCGRGCADTVAAFHASGTKAYFFSSGGYGVAFDYYDDGDAVDIKLLPQNASGSLDDATALSFTLDQRANKPYPAGKLRVNTAAYPAAIMSASDVAIAWAHRDRTQQLGDLDDEATGNIGPETDVEYTLKYYDETNTLRKTVSAITGTSDAWTTEVSDCGLGRLNNSIRIELITDRDGLLAHQNHDFSFNRADWGFSWGLHWGGY